MAYTERDKAMSRIENIAQRVYRDHKNALFMLVNDLEEFFEINNTGNDASRMTSDEFDTYIKNILEGDD